MGVVNANPDSFSDGGPLATLDAARASSRALLVAGRRDHRRRRPVGDHQPPEVEADEEISRVVPLVERMAAEPRRRGLGRHLQAGRRRAALDAGRVDRQRRQRIALPRGGRRVRARGRRLVVMHNRWRPKQRLTDPALYEDVVGRRAWLPGEEKLAAAPRGRRARTPILDPGPDFSKTPGPDGRGAPPRSMRVARARPARAARRCRARTSSGPSPAAPRARLAGTLAAVGLVRRRPGQILRVHDVAEVADFLVTAEALEGDRERDGGPRAPAGSAPRRLTRTMARHARRP